jgi:hypothetical protein
MIVEGMAIDRYVAERLVGQGGMAEVWAGPWRAAMARAWNRMDASHRSALTKLRVLGMSFGLTEAESVLRSDCDEQLAELVSRGFLHDGPDERWRMVGAVSRFVGGFAETTL